MKQSFTFPIELRCKDKAVSAFRQYLEATPYRRHRCYRKML